jgi:hypothetical protein
MKHFIQRCFCFADTLPPVRPNGVPAGESTIHRCRRDSESRGGQDVKAMPRPLRAGPSDPALLVVEISRRRSVYTSIGALAKSGKGFFFSMRLSHRFALRAPNYDATGAVAVFTTAHPILTGAREHSGHRGIILRRLGQTAQTASGPALRFRFLTAESKSIVVRRCGRLDSGSEQCDIVATCGFLNKETPCQRSILPKTVSVLH